MYGLSEEDLQIQARARGFADELIPFEDEAERANGELPPDVTAAHAKRARELGLHDVRHAHVEQDQLGLQTPRSIDRFPPVGRLADHVETVARKQRRECLAGERMVVNNQDSRSHVPLIGGYAPAD